MGTYGSEFFHFFPLQKELQICLGIMFYNQCSDGTAMEFIAIPPYLALLFLLGEEEDP